jgi:hypothetical protein
MRSWEALMEACGRRASQSCVTGQPLVEVHLRPAVNIEGLLDAVSLVLLF